MMHRFSGAGFVALASRSHPHTLVGAVALVILLAACVSGGATSPTTEASPAHSTTTTNPPQTTSRVGPETSTTAAAVAVPEDTTPTNVSITPETAAVVLRPDGLGVVSFGVSVDETVASLTSALGDPTSGTPATELEFIVQDLWADEDDGMGLIWDRPWYQSTCWEQLCTVYGGNSSDELFFTGWFMNPFNRGRELEVSEFAPMPYVVTNEGITIGSTVDELRAAYPEVEFFIGEGGTALFDMGWTPRGFAGIAVVGPGRLLKVGLNNLVYQLAAGDGPWNGCC